MHYLRVRLTGASARYSDTHTHIMSSLDRTEFGERFDHSVRLEGPTTTLQPLNSCFIAERGRRPDPSSGCVLDWFRSSTTTAESWPA